MIKGLSESQNNIVTQVLSSVPKIDEVILYGSRAKGNYGENSDIDLTLKGQNLDHAVLQNLLRKFDESTLPFTIDLSIYDNIQSSDLIEHIKRVGICIFKKD